MFFPTLKMVTLGAAANPDNFGHVWYIYVNGCYLGTVWTSDVEAAGSLGNAVERVVSEAGPLDEQYQDSVWQQASRYCLGQ